MNTSPITPTCKQVESMVENMAQAYAQTQQTMATMAMQSTRCSSDLMQVTSAYMPMLAKAQTLPDAAYTMATLFGAYTHIMQQAFIGHTRACSHLMQQTQTMAQRYASMPWLNTPQAPTQSKPTQSLSERIAQRLSERKPIQATPTPTTTTHPVKKTKPKATPAALLVSALAAKAQLKWAQNQMETIIAKPAAPIQAKVEVTTVADTADAMTHFPVPPTLPSAYPMVSSTANSVMRVSHHNVTAAHSAHARGVRQSVMARRSARVVKVAR